MKQQHYYRPEWTCGRYNPKHNVAIIYNLLKGQSFFFESHSARVIGEMLKTPRNGEICPEKVADHTGIHIESIREFINLLQEVNLIVTMLPTSKEMITIRQMQGEWIKAMESNRSDINKKETLPYDMTTAEQAYNAAVADEYTITSVMLELTYNCSERCIHCYNVGAVRSLDEQSQRSREEMNLDDYKRVIDELDELGVYKVCLSGGDPFSKPIVWEIIDYLYHKEIAFDIYTNGLAIADKVDRLIEYNPRLVGLSVYSAIPEEHDRVTRVNGSYRKTMTVAKQLSDAGINIAFKCVVFRTNVKSYHTVQELAKEYGAIYQLETNLCNGIDGDTSVVDNLRLPTEAMEIVLRDPHSPLYVGTETLNIRKDMEQHPCGAGETSFTITPEGYMTPCVGFPARIGDLRKQTIREIIATSDSLRKWRKTKITDIDECGRLEKCAYCFLCVGNAYIEHGNILRPAMNNCYMAEIRYNLAKKLQHGEDPLKGMSIPERLRQMEISDGGKFRRCDKKSFRNEEFKIK